jgi:hypothetical protein
LVFSKRHSNGRERRERKGRVKREKADIQGHKYEGQRGRERKGQAATKCYRDARECKR